MLCPVFTDVVIWGLFHSSVAFDGLKVTDDTFSHQYGVYV